MATEYGSGRIATSGLVLSLDAADKNSYPGSGTTWFDRSGNGNNGTLNGTTFNTISGGAIQFNGSSDYVSFASLNNLNNPYATHEVWVQFLNPTLPQNEQVISRTNTSAGTFNILKRDSNDDLNGFIRVSTNTQTSIVTGVVISTNWLHIAITYDGTTFILYSNAINSAQTTISSETINTGGTFNMNLGRNTAAAAYFNGYMSIARAYNRALSATEVLQNYNATKSRFGL